MNIIVPCITVCSVLTAFVSRSRRQLEADLNVVREVEKVINHHCTYSAQFLIISFLTHVHSLKKYKLRMGRVLSLW